MKIHEFYDNLRNNYFENFKNDRKIIEQKKLEELDQNVLNVLQKNKNEQFILNNKLSCYLIYLEEKGLLRNEISKIFYNNVYTQFNRVSETLNLLESITKDSDSKILLIKTLNVIPYFPVYDFDIFVESKKIISYLDKFSKYYKRSNEDEENKINFVPVCPEKFFKLSFHLDITWDGFKTINLSPENLWRDCISYSSNIFVNSPFLEAQIKLQECKLERLYYNVIDYLFIKNYMPSNFNNIKKFKSLNSLPQFISLSELSQYKERKTLYKKNLKRWLIWKAYSKFTGKIPFSESLNRPL